MRREPGFTIIELVVVISIFGILAGIGLPFFHTFAKNYRLKSAISTLRGDFNHARSLARANRQNYLLLFTDANTYQIQDANGNAVVTRDCGRNVSREAAEAGSFTFLPTGLVTCTGYNPPAGACNTADANDFTLTLTNDLDRMQIVITGVGGGSLRSC